jgi:hypothetical protein
MMGTAGRSEDAPLGPLGLDAQAWGAFLLRSWAGILDGEPRSRTGRAGIQRSPNPVGVPAVTLGIQTIRL